ncbi:lipid-binding SYLF domain-containing protein [Sulfurospirillum sp. 1307]
MKKIFLALVLLICVFSSVQANSSEEMLLDSVNTMKKLVNTKNGVPKSVLKQAKAILIIPSLDKVGFFIGGKYGKGVVCIKKSDGSWSYPFFVEVVGGSLGLQFGYEHISAMMIFRTQNSVNELMNKKFTLGAGASVSAGPLGSNYERNTEVNMSAEIFVYSKANGLFAGVSLEGAVISILEEKNRALYGQNLNVNQIVSGSNLSSVYSVKEFLRTVNSLTK